MADSVIPKNIDARLSLTGELMDSLWFAAGWIRWNPNGKGFRLADGESLETHLRNWRKGASKSALQFLDEIDRVLAFDSELRGRVDALDIADPGGIPERRDLRGLRITARVSHRLLVDGSSDPAKTSRAPTVSLQSNRTPDELDAIVGKLQIQYRELRAYSLLSVESASKSAGQRKGATTTRAARIDGKKISDRQRAIYDEWNACGRDAAKAARNLKITATRVKTAVALVKRKMLAAGITRDQSIEADQTLPSIDISEHAGASDAGRSRRLRATRTSRLS